MKQILETARLRLIPFDLSNVDLLHKTLTDPYIRRYLMDDEVISYEKATEFIQVNEDHFEKSSWGLWKLILKADETFVGFAGLWLFFGEDQPQLLYGLLPCKIKNGYAREASKAVIDYVFEKLRFQYLTAACDTPNLESRRVCEHLKMKETGEKEINGFKTSFYRLER